jgi:hypothetical protein
MKIYISGKISGTNLTETRKHFAEIGMPIMYEIEQPIMDENE